MAMAMALIQKIHRQFWISCVTHPPMMGPRTGPSCGARAKTVMAEPRCSGEKMSVMTAPPIDMGALAPSAVKNRKNIIIGDDDTKPLARVKMKKNAQPMSSTGLRPRTSLIGPKMSGAKAKAST